MCVIWLNDSRARSWSAPTSIQRAQTPGRERNSRGGEEEKDESMKRKQYLGLFVCLYLQSSLPRKRGISCFLDHILENLYLCRVMGPHQLPAKGVRRHHPGLFISIKLSFLTTHVLELVLSWTQVATLLAFPPFSMHIQWGSDSVGLLSVLSIFIICISQNLAGCL